MAERVNDLLLPIVKGVGSERAYQCLTESLQTLGGSGFLQDYPLEQYVRDAKIDSLYEGTTAIQAQDFFFRKIVRDQGVALQHVIAQIKNFLGASSPREELADGRALLATALADLEAMVAAMTGCLFEIPRERPRVVSGGSGVGAVPACGGRPADRMAAASPRRDRTRRTRP